MSRGRWATLIVVVLATAAALVAGMRSGPATGKPADSALAPLRASAALSPCPTGVSPQLPRLTLPCLGGGPPVALNGAPAGKPTLVNVYGSWCTPCFKEMPLLVAFSKASAGKVSLLGIDTEDESRLALVFARQVGQTWPAVQDDDRKVLTAYASGPPVTLFVDAAGVIQHVKVGPFAGVSEIQALTRQYLGVST